MLELPGELLVAGPKAPEVTELLRNCQLEARWRPTHLPECGLDLMFELSEHAYAIYEEARVVMSPRDVMDVLHVFPRDAPGELLFMFAIGRLAAFVRYLALSRFACPIHVMDEPSRAANGHVRRPALVLPWEHSVLILFPQVPMAVWGDEHKSRRLDFLAYYVEPGPRRRSMWSALELDDPTHPRRADDDAIRDRSVWIPTIRLKLWQIVRPDLGAQLIMQIRELMKEFGAHERRLNKKRRKTVKRWSEKRAERQALAG
jgi:hypothetical protein